MKDKIDKLQTVAIILAGVAAFAIMSQPVWRADEMIEEIKSDCDKRGGVMIEHKRRFGTNYKCESRLD